MTYRGEPSHRMNVRPLDPVLQEQLETSLHGTYAFNAEMAKFGIIWVWIVKLPAIGTSLAAVFSLVIVALLLITGEDIDLGSRANSALPYDTWPLWLLAVGGFSILALFFCLMTKAMEASHRLSLDMARRYSGFGESTPGSSPLSTAP